MSKRMGVEQMRAALNAEMQAANANRAATGTGNPLPAAEPGEFGTGTAIIRLRVSEVDAYDDNPRTEPNGKYAEIRESIRVRGLDHRLVVTKRPGASRYMLAKGGKTRLEILQELAAEDPRFEYQDFDVVPYKSESELLVAHIVENNQRDGMSFWDTANGYLKLRDKRSRELGRDISLREFSGELKAQGLGIGVADLGNFDFLIRVLAPMAEIAKRISRTDVRNNLRPQCLAIEEVTSRLLPAKSGVAFQQAYADWLVAFSESWRDLQQDPPSQDLVERDDSTSTGLALRLSAAIHREAAQWLSLTESELRAALEALSADRKVDGDGLRAAVRAADYSPAADSTVAPALPFPPPPQDVTEAAAGESEEPHDASKDHSGDTHTWTEGESSGRVPHGLNGVTPVPMSAVASLVRLDSKGKPIAPEASGMAPGASETSPEPIQGDLPGTTTREQAEEALQTAVLSLTEFAGITELLRAAPGMPLTYFMDLPKRPLGDDARDYAVQAWWFLANLAGQFTRHCFQLSQRHEGQVIYALYDTGPEGFRQIASSEQTLVAVVQSHLGGVYATEGVQVLDLLTDPNNPMSELALDLVRCAAGFRLHRG